MVIDVASKTIREARFRSNGCGYMIAAADRIAEAIEERELPALHSIDGAEFTAIVTDELGVFPAERSCCLNAVLGALRSALADYRAYLLEEFRGEKPLICTCFAVTEEEIANFVVKNGPHSVEEVSAGCRAGSGCGSCRMLIQEMLDLHDGRV